MVTARGQKIWSFKTRPSSTVLNCWKLLKFILIYDFAWEEKTSMNLIEDGRYTRGHLLSHFSEPESVYLSQKYVKIYRVWD